MRKNSKRGTFVTKSFSFPPDVAEFIDLRAKAIEKKPSNYIADLVRHDRESNVSAEIARKAFERISTVAA